MIATGVISLAETYLPHRLPDARSSLRHDGAHRAPAYGAVFQHHRGVDRRASARADAAAGLGSGPLRTSDVTLQTSTSSFKRLTSQLQTSNVRFQTFFRPTLQPLALQADAHPTLRAGRAHNGSHAGQHRQTRRHERICRSSDNRCGIFVRGLLIACSSSLSGAGGGRDSVRCARAARRRLRPSGAAQHRPRIRLRPRQAVSPASTACTTAHLHAERGSADCRVHHNHSVNEDHPVRGEVHRHAGRAHSRRRLGDRRGRRARGGRRRRRRSR